MLNKLIPFLLTCLLSFPAFAQDHAHDDVFMRVTGGVGYHVVDGPGADFDGASLSLGGDLGLFVVENTALSAHVGTVVMLDPTVEVGGHTSANSVDLMMMMYGVGLTHFFGDSYLALTGGLTTLDTARSDVSDPGFFGMIDMGHEWWVANNCALGLGVRGMTSYIDNAGSEFKTFGVQALVTGTYN